MPRLSADARAAAAFRAGGGHPRPPKGMPKGAAKVWREIVEARPVDFFQPGQLHLLEVFCRTAELQRAALLLLESDPADDGAAKQVARLAAIMASHATKLRLTISSASRPDAAINREKPAKPSGLLGGHVVELRGAR